MSEEDESAADDALDVQSSGFLLLDAAADSAAPPPAALSAWRERGVAGERLRLALPHAALRIGADRVLHGQLLLTTHRVRFVTRHARVPDLRLADIGCASPRPASARLTPFRVPQCARHSLVV